MPAPTAIITLPVPSPENPSWLSALVRDPLLHFLLLGAGLFLLYGAFGNPPPPADEVVIDRPSLERLSQQFQPHLAAAARRRPSCADSPMIW